MTTKTEDDFWNTSSSSGFNFDDDDDLSQPMQDFIFHSSTEETSVLPIHSLISKNCLDFILDDVKSANEYVVPPVEEVIRKMFNGQKYSLQVYKRFSDKLLLLDSALECNDVNILLTVIIFLKSTLRRNIFYHQLGKRKLAVKQYANHLIVNNSYQELADLYMATGNHSNMKQLYYLIGKDIAAKDVLYKRLEQFMIEHLQKLNNNDERLELHENMQLLQWQIERKQTALTAIEQLAVLCKAEWEKDKNCSDALKDYKKLLRIDDFSYEWTVMNVMASMQLWPQLANFFIKPNWLTKKNVLKTVMSSEHFIYGLSRHKPPKDVLEQYFVCISDSERSLYLAQKFNCYKFVIQHFSNQRDRQALINYKAKFGMQSEEYFLIENALQSSDKKWKN